MSGVNAHMLLGRPEACGTITAAPRAAAARQLPWRRARLWPAPFLHHLVHPVLGAAKGIVRYAQCSEQTGWTAALQNDDMV